MFKEKPSAPRPRIESLSDLVFGLALSIGAIYLLNTLPKNPIEIMSDILGFAFSFLILIFVWLRYTDIMSVLPIETRSTMFLNVVMLFLIAIEPYLFNLVSMYSHVASIELIDSASFTYALDMAGLMIMLAFFTHQLAVEEKNLVPKEMLSKYRRLRNSYFVWALLFLITMLPQFWFFQIQGTPIRFYFWAVPLVASWIGGVYWGMPKSKKISRPVT